MPVSNTERPSRSTNRVRKYLAALGVELLGASVAELHEPSLTPCDDVDRLSVRGAPIGILSGEVINQGSSIGSFGDIGVI
ncbi:hypothetical protein BRAS3843_670010 [Bradyrhizobium sp. STM 3843]|nr:hypothetical protein BRAS3843_670010 [Bradyrhizobium sp. STM 3843]